MLPNKARQWILRHSTSTRSNTQITTVYNKPSDKELSKQPHKNGKSDLFNTQIEEIVFYTADDWSLQHIYSFHRPRSWVIVQEVVFMVPEVESSSHKLFSLFKKMFHRPGSWCYHHRSRFYRQEVVFIVQEVVSSSRSCLDCWGIFLNLESSDCFLNTLGTFACSSWRIALDSSFLDKKQGK